MTRYIKTSAHVRISLKRKLFAGAVLFITFLMCLFFYIEASLRPIISESSRSRARAYATEIINNAVNGVLSNSGQLVQVSQGSDGIYGVQTDIAAMSKLRTEVIDSISEAVKDPDIMRLSVPLGTLTKSSVLGGKGFPITIRLVPIGDITSDIRTEFIESGINQTMHKITLRVRMTFNVIAAGDMIKTELATDITLAETVIVGKVPDAYTAINRFEIDEDEENDLNDYAATLP